MDTGRDMNQRSLIRLMRFLVILALIGVSVLSAAEEDGRNSIHCGDVPDDERLARSVHVFSALITESEFIPEPNLVERSGLIRAWFEVLEVLRGDPGKVPYLEAEVAPVDIPDGFAPKSQPGSMAIPVGRRVLVFARNDGPQRIDQCRDAEWRWFDERVSMLRQRAEGGSP